MSESRPPEDPPSAPSLLHQARLVEATSLSQTNQRRRVLAEATLAVMACLLTLVSAIAIAAHNADIFLVAPPATLFLTALSFQQYADVSVIGVARHVLEEHLNRELGAAGLIYESRVADIRKSPPLVRSIRVLQGATRAAVLASAGAGAYIAATSPWWAAAAYAIGTLAALWCCCGSYRAMVTAGPTARDTLAEL